VNHLFYVFNISQPLPCSLLLLSVSVPRW